MCAWTSLQLHMSKAPRLHITCVAACVVACSAAPHRVSVTSSRAFGLKRQILDKWIVDGSGADRLRQRCASMLAHRPQCPLFRSRALADDAPSRRTSEQHLTIRGGPSSYEVSKDSHLSFTRSPAQAGANLSAPMGWRTRCAKFKEGSQFHVQDPNGNSGYTALKSVSFQPLVYDRLDSYLYVRHTLRNIGALRVCTQRCVGSKQLLRPRPKEVNALSHASAIVAIA